LFVLLLVVTEWVAVVDRSRLASLRGTVAAAVTYSSNWFLIAANNSYFARFAPPAPLDHLWSLAVEEQFYLVWPWLIMFAIYWVARRKRTSVRWLALPTLALAAASAVEMMVLYQPGFDPTRVYEGTDTRAFGLLIGAALAMAWPGRRTAPGTGAEPGSRAEPGNRTRHLLDGAGLAGLTAIGLMIWRVGQYSPFAYSGGLILLSVATALVIAAVACPCSLVGNALGWRPLRWIGVRSYGIYLWHFPVIVLTTPSDTGENLPRAALQVTASVVLAALSWRYVEEPVRQGAVGRLRDGLRSAGWRNQRVRLGGVAIATGATGLVVVACASLTGTFPAGGSKNAAAVSAGSVLPPASKSTTTLRGGAHPRSAAASPAASGPAGPLRTSCRAVTHLGDSTSDGLVSPEYLPNPAQRIVARYEDVGVRSIRTDISGARSVVEVLPGQVNGFDAAKAAVRAGFRGCWVVALGTNDTADVAVGSHVGLATRIQRMMSATDGEPVMWVNVKSLLVSGPYAEPNMLRWDTALLRACARYPNMRVFDWASVVQRRWFISDGIHYTSRGYRARARFIAGALAKAFPRSGQSAGCVVG
jgi:peptidoglycan/LPS O-acetylase OafA/YrhL